MKQEQDTKVGGDVKKKKAVNMERSTAGTKYRNPDGLAVTRAYRPPEVATARNSNSSPN